MADSRNTGKLVTVYGLASSEDRKIRYVGQTCRSLARRLYHHRWKAAKEHNHRGAWIRSVLTKGHELLIFAIEENAIPHEAEQRLISWYRKHGADLVNSTGGGMGSLGFRKTPEEIERLRALHSGKPKSAEHRAKIAAAHKGRKSPWTAARNKAATGTKRGPLSEEHKAKVSAANSGIKKPWLAELNRKRAGQPWSQERRERSKRRRAASS